MTQKVRSDQSGMTLIELIIGLTIMGFITLAAMQVLSQQELAFALGANQMEAVQNYRFAAETLDRNLRTAGMNTAPGQPFLVYADSATVSINADYTSNDPGDVFAVYVTPGAPAQETGALTRSRRIVLPRTSFSYPDTTYRNGTVNSSAETITFFFAPDEDTERRDDYVLFRQVNDLAPEVVSRGLLRMPGRPFFSYMEEIRGDTIVPRAAWVSPASLPLRHSVPMHLSVADTGSAARIDRIRTVQVSFASVAGKDEREQRSSVTRSINLPNAGRQSLRTCGDEPLFGSMVGASRPSGELRAIVTWSASVDEETGERDVVRYAIYRREVPSTDWGEPYFSVPAGQPSYAYSDGNVTAGSTYQYAIAAQDCTPALSGLRISPELTITP